LPSTNYHLYDFYLRAMHARALLPAALASVLFEFVFVRVRARFARDAGHYKRKIQISGFQFTSSTMSPLLFMRFLHATDNSFCVTLRAGSHSWLLGNGLLATSVYTLDLLLLTVFSLID